MGKVGKSLGHHILFTDFTSDLKERKCEKSLEKCFPQFCIQHELFRSIYTDTLTDLFEKVLCVSLKGVKKNGKSFISGSFPVSEASKSLHWPNSSQLIFVRTEPNSQPVGEVR